jgi:hypothetical protein
MVPGSVSDGRCRCDTAVSDVTISNKDENNNNIVIAPVMLLTVTCDVKTHMIKSL